MGRKIITNNKDKWEIFSSSTDSVIAEFETEKDLKEFIVIDGIYEAKLKAIKTLMTFPQGWVVNDKRIFAEANQENSQNYLEWLMKISKESKTYEEYYTKIDEKLEELMNK